MSTGSGKSVFTPITIKKEPLDNNGINSSLKNDRLTSFKVPRDLTLGGVQPLRTRGPNKKIYAPNLNAIRNKNASVKTSRDTTSNRGGRGRGDRGKSDRGGRGGRGAGRGSLIQTSGVFSEGAGDMILRKTSGSFRYSNDNEDITSMRKPTLIKQEGKIDKNKEKQYLKDIMGDSDDDDFENKKIATENCPIKLSEAKWNVKLEIKSEMDTFDGVIKEEPTSGYDNEIINETSQLKIKPDYDIKMEDGQYPINMDDLFQRTTPQIFLMQLPDSLPGEPPEAPATSGEGSADQATSSSSVNSSACTLKQLDEGQIGKIVKYKSGKYKLILGEKSRFDLNLGLESGFLQELMSINTNREERNGNMINLGPVQAKVTAIPDWEYIFKNYT